MRAVGRFSRHSVALFSRDTLHAVHGCSGSRCRHVSTGDLPHHVWVATRLYVLLDAGFRRSLFTRDTLHAAHKSRGSWCRHLSTGDLPNHLRAATRLFVLVDAGFRRSLFTRVGAVELQLDSTVQPKFHEVQFDP